MGRVFTGDACEGSANGGRATADGIPAAGPGGRLERAPLDQQRAAGAQDAQGAGCTARSSRHVFSPRCGERPRGSPRVQLPGPRSLRHARDVARAVRPVGTENRRRRRLDQRSGRDVPGREARATRLVNVFVLRVVPGGDDVDITLVRRCSQPVGMIAGIVVLVQQDCARREGRCADQRREREQQHDAALHARPAASSCRTNPAHGAPTYHETVSLASPGATRAAASPSRPGVRADGLNPGAA